MKSKEFLKKENMVNEAREEFGRFPEYIGGYFPPFYANGKTVEDKHGTAVLDCKNEFFVRVVVIALNEQARKH